MTDDKTTEPTAPIREVDELALLAPAFDQARFADWDDYDLESIPDANEPATEEADDRQ